MPRVEKRKKISRFSKKKQFKDYDWTFNALSSCIYKNEGKN